MQIKQVVNSWQQLTGLLLLHPEKKSLSWHRKQKNMKKNKKNPSPDQRKWILKELSGRP
jgi:hypothetical protein